MISLIGLLAGLALLIFLTIRGLNLLIAAPLCALIVAITGGIALYPQAGVEADFISGYMDGFAGFVAAWFLMFLLGALFGKVMEDTGAADSVADWIVSRLGRERALLAVVAACAVLTYGGVSLFVVAFSVYPMALSLFRESNLPRRFIPATIAFGSVTFTMTSAGSPEIQNWIPIPYLGTTPYAGWEVSSVVALFMALTGYWLLNRMVGAARERGEQFDARPNDPVLHREQLPPAWTGAVPLAVVLVVSFWLHEAMAQAALIVALLAGVLATLILNRAYIHDLEQATSDGVTGALIAIGNTAAVVGFGSVAKLSPAFALAVDAMTNLPGNELIGAAIAVSAIAALTGSASGGQAIALPEVAPVYLERGVDPEALHRVVAISSGALDTLPHNGYVVTTIRAICNETHRAAYGPLAMLTLVVPLIGTGLAIGLFALIG